MPITDGSIPHFDLPFRLIARQGQRASATVEQDTLDDVANCVEMAVRYRQGQRFMIPTFGITDPVFKIIPIDTVGMSAQISKHEPRANMLLREYPDFYDELVDQIKINVSLRRPGA